MTGFQRLAFEHPKGSRRDFLAFAAQVQGILAAAYSGFWLLRCLPSY